MSMIAQAVLTPQLATAASMLCRLAHPNDASLHRALGKAEGRLLCQPWRVESGILHIASVSQPNVIHSTDGITCTCPTSRGVCYHIAGHLMLVTICAAGALVIAPLPLPAVLEVDELPGSFLDGDFETFEDTALLTIPPRRDTVVNEHWIETHEPVVAKRGLAPLSADFARAQRLADELFPVAA